VAPPKEDGEGEAGDGDAKNDATTQIRELASRIEYLEHASESVLSLPEGDNKQNAE